MNHKATCPRRNYEEIIAAKLEEREGSQAVGLDEDDYLCNCQPEPAAPEATARRCDCNPHCDCECHKAQPDSTALDAEERFAKLLKIVRRRDLDQYHDYEVHQLFVGAFEVTSGTKEHCEACAGELLAELRKAKP